MAKTDDSLILGNIPRSDGQYGDGLTTLDPSIVIVSGSHADFNQRAGFLFHCNPPFSGVAAMKDSFATANAFGIVGQSCSWDIVDIPHGGSNTITGNSERDIWLDGNLPIPDEPAALPSP